MAAREAGWIAAHPLTAFVLLALGITWAAWEPAAAAFHGLVPLGSPAAGCPCGPPGAEHRDRTRPP